MGKLVYFATDSNTNLCIFWGFIHLFIAHLIVTMSVQPFLFEPTYPPGEEPSNSQGEDEEEGGELDENGSRIGSAQWCSCGGCETMPTDDECFCCQELEGLNQKFDESGLILPLFLFECSLVKQRENEVSAFAVFSCSFFERCQLHDRSCKVQDCLFGY